MGSETKIQWCDFTFNPWEGCTKVSPGCAHCYAETRNARFGGGTSPNWGPGKPRRRTSSANWKQPLKWNREAANAGCGDCDPCLGLRPDQCAVDPSSRPRVFCASIADWLDEEVPVEWLADLLWLGEQTPGLDWLRLTKRPELWRSRLEAVAATTHPASVGALAWLNGRPPANVWVGTSVENQEWADRRIPLLMKIPAKIRFLSVEPLLGPIDLAVTDCGMGSDWIWSDYIKWVILGGESGPGARPCDVNWIRSLIDQCRPHNVAPFVKQLGGVPMDSLQSSDHRERFTRPGRWTEGMFWPTMKDKKGGDMAEWPEAIRIREFPT